MRSFTIPTCLLALAVAFGSGATGGPLEVLITPASASGLGFSIAPARDDSGVLIVEVKGPAVDKQGCRASRSGVALLDGSRELLVSITELPDGTTGPTQMGYSTHSGRMSMFFDYLRCPEGVYPNQYTIQSIDAFSVK